jgi:peptidoglycan-associated lipoprotein
MKRKFLIVSAFVVFAAGSLLAQSQMMASTESPTAADGGAAVPSTPDLPPNPAATEAVRDNVKDIHFDFDRADLRPEERATLDADAQWLKAHPDTIVTIEGDADERGDIVYNVDLSQKRASVTKDALVAMGVSADQIVFATGWGKLYPVCEQSDESCWSENRRAHFRAW